MSTRENTTQKPTVDNAIDRLLSLGINFLALDFDQTILDIHTGGNWKGSLEELFPHIRPVYADLILAALVSKRIEVAVVTFSCQTRFVRGVLDHIVSRLDGSILENLGIVVVVNNSNSCSGHPLVDTTSKIPIRGGDRSWKYSGTGSMDGKQPHMASAVEELEARREEDYQQRRKELPSEPPEHITRKTTLLLDDDSRNIRYALQNGVRAIWFNPKRPKDLLPEMMQLI